MHGLNSKLALKNRHTRWTSTGSSRNPSEAALERARSSTTASSDTTIIFNVLDSQTNPAFTIEPSDDDESRERTPKLDQYMETIKLVLKQQEEILRRLDALEKTLQPPPNITPSSESDSKDDPISSHDGTTFTPYFIKPMYVGKENRTKLENDELSLTVEILSYYPEPPIIYPFQDSTTLPHFTELTLNLSMSDVDNNTSGTLYGIFKRNDAGVYTITLTEIYVDGTLTTLDKCPFPIILKCDTTLVKE